MDRQIVLHRDRQRHFAARRHENVARGPFDRHARRLIGDGANIPAIVGAPHQAFGVFQLDPIGPGFVDHQRLTRVSPECKTMRIARQRGGPLALFLMNGRGSQFFCRGARERDARAAQGVNVFFAGLDGQPAVGRRMERQLQPFEPRRFEHFQADPLHRRIVAPLGPIGERTRHAVLVRHHRSVEQLHRLDFVLDARRAVFIAIMDAHFAGHAVLVVVDELDFERLSRRQPRRRVAEGHAIKLRPGVVAQRANEPRDRNPGVGGRHRRHRNRHERRDGRRRQRPSRGAPLKNLRKIQTLGCRGGFQNHVAAQRGRTGLSVGFRLLEKLDRAG